MEEPVHIKPLTALRFFAAYWVVFFHYWPKLAGVGTPGVIDKGYLGVELFFVLSGFILSHVYLPAFEQGRFRYADFLWARLARIYPVHLLTLVGVGVMGTIALALGLEIDPNIVSLPALPANLAMMQAWGLSPVAGWNHPSWSISAEWAAYLAFPLFALIAARMARWPGVAVAGAMALTAVMYAVFPRITGFPLTKATIDWGALRIVPCFALGSALFLAWRASAADRRKSLAGAAFWGAAALLSAQFEAPDVVTVATFAGVIFSLAQVFKAGSRFGSSRLLIYLGEISYAIYMICIPWELVFVNLVVKFAHFSTKVLPLPLWIVLLLGPIPLAAAIHHLVERPARQRLKLWWTHGQGHKLATATPG